MFHKKYFDQISICEIFLYILIYLKYENSFIMNIYSNLLNKNHYFKMVISLNLQ